MERKHIKSTVILAFVTLLIFVVSGAAAWYSYHKSNADKTAYIYHGDELLYTIDLNAVTEPYTIEINTEDGSNTVEVHSGAIGVTDADCPDRICVDTGFIGDGAMPVICVPHKLMIVVRDRGGDVDAQI